MKKSALMVRMVSAGIFMTSLCYMQDGSQAIAATDLEKFKQLTIRRVSGLEWLQMSVGQRLDTLLKSMAILAGKGYAPDQTINDYYDSVSEKLRTNPVLYQEDVTVILETAMKESGLTPRKIATGSNGPQNPKV